MAARGRGSPHGGSDSAISRLAGDNEGIVDLPDLLGLGLSREGVKRRIASGRLHVLHEGVYAVGHRAISERGRWIAALRAGGAEALLCCFSGGRLIGLSIEEGARVDVCVPPTGRRSRRGLVIHAVALPPEDRTVHRGLPVTAAPRLLLDLAWRVSTRKLDVFVAEASHKGILKPAALTSLLGRSAGHRGIRALREATRGYRQEDRTRSVPEASFLILCRRTGIADPAVNVPIGDLEVDFYWPDARLIVEIDGFSAHRGRESFEGDRARAVHFRLLGYEYLAFTPRQVHQRQSWVVSSVQTALARGRQVSR